MAKANLTSSRLRELLHYCPLTGIFTRVKAAGSRPIGSMAGNINKDHRICIYVDNKNYKAHRLAWLYVYGYFPSEDVDHIDGDPSNNRLANLREVSHRVNQQNRRGPTKSNELGVMGVIRNKKRFGAQIVVNGVRVWLGTYDTPELANAVYMQARRTLLPGNTI